MISSGGGPSGSGGYASKLLVSVTVRTVGVIGGSKLWFLSPSQLKPSNHLLEDTFFSNNYIFYITLIELTYAFVFHLFLRADSQDVPQDYPYTVS